LVHLIEWLKNKRGDLLFHLPDGLDHLMDTSRVAPLLDGLPAQLLQFHADLLEFRVASMAACIICSSLCAAFCDI